MATSVKNLAFIVLCWNNKDLLDECLRALKAQTYSHTEVYVIDHNSSDGSAEYIKKNYPEVHLTASKENYGFAKGNNILVDKALKNKNTSHVALVNTDAMLAPDWASRLMKFADGKPKAACLQGLTIDYYNHKKIDAHHIFIRRDLQAVQYGYGQSNRNNFYHTTKVFGVNAAAALYSRKFIESQPRHQLFDERFFMYLEDVDVSFRALMEGWENYFVEGAEAYHMGSVSAKKQSSDYSLYMTFRNHSAVLFKNMPFMVFWSYLPLALRFEAVFYRHTLKTNGLGGLRKLLQGRIVGVLRLPIYWQSRRKAMRGRKISNQYLANLIWQDGL